MTRVTHRTIQESTLANLQGNLTKMNTLQEQLSTGKKINRPSDDPTGTVTALQTRQTLRANEQYVRNADDGLGWLNTADTALKDTTTALQRAQVLVTAGLNDGAQSDSSRAALAVEIRGLRDNLVGLANTKYGDRNIFAGTSALEKPLEVNTTATPTTYTWPVAGGAVERQIDAGSKVQVDIPGESVFGKSGQSVFELLDNIAAQLTSSPDATTRVTGLSRSLGELRTAMTDVSLRASEVGARTNRIEAAQSAAEDAKITLGNQLSAVEDIDLPETIIRLQTQEVAYKAALGATAKVLQPSLMDFLR